MDNLGNTGTSSLLVLLSGLFSKFSGNSGIPRSLDTLKGVDQEQIIHSDVLHSCVLNVEDENIKTEVDHCGQWLQLLQLGSLLVLQSCESASLRTDSKESCHH